MDAENLFLAAREGNLELVKQCIEYGVDVNSYNGGWTSLLGSSYNGHYLVVKYLLEKEADVNLRDCYGGSALIFSCRREHQAISSLLLDYDADTSFICKLFGTAETNSLEHGWNFDEMRIQSYYRSPLYFDHLFCCAIEEPKKEIVKKSKKRKREGEEEEKEAEKPFMQKFMATVIFADLIFVHRVLPFLFGPYDP